MTTTDPTSAELWAHLALEYRDRLEAILRDANILVGLAVDHHPGHGEESLRIVSYLLFELDNKLFDHTAEAKKLAADYDALKAADHAAANPPAPPPSPASMAAWCRDLARQYDRRAAEGMEGSE